MQQHFWPNSMFRRRPAISPGGSDHPCCVSPACPFLARGRRGVTLIEMLISVTLTLLIVFAVVQIFQYLGETVAIGRATIEMSGQLRTVSNRLQADIDSLTCPVKTWIEPAMGAGYFYYREGPPPGNDYDPTASTPQQPMNRTLTDLEGMIDWSTGQARSPALPIGDQDDILAMTIRSRDEPFRSDTGFTSQVAEVVWWVAALDTDGSGNLTDADVRYLLRRVFLVLPGTNVGGLGPNADVTYRMNGTTRVANSLADLTTPENRMMNNSEVAFPPFILPAVWQSTYARFAVMGDILAFDVRAYDPQAAIFSSEVPTSPAAFAVVPGDAGYAEAVKAAVAQPNRLIGYGAFVDLNFANLYYHYLSQQNNFQTLVAGNNGRLPSLVTGDFADHPQLPNGAAQWFNTPIAYDTWTTIYERDGVDNDGDSIVDDETNGLDDDSINGIDDFGERETSPPYDLPLRGIEVRMRMIEPSTGQVRQVSVVGDFVAK